ncbi:MAG: flippase [Patescibacteria group bacterium]|nr:flippase [Patescibacteria group bacterium]
MNKIIAKNTLFLSVSQIISRGIGFFYYIFLARALGVVDFGFYTFTLAFVYNFIPVADFGLERLVLKEISREPEKASFYLGRLLPLRVFLAIATYFAVLFLGLLLGQPGREIGYLAIFGLGLIPYNLTFFLASFWNAKEKMAYLSIINLCLTVLTAILGSAFFYLNLKLTWVLLAYPLANLLLGGMVFLHFQKEQALEWKIDLSFWKKALASSWIFGALTILGVFYLRISVVMIGLLRGPSATAIYGSAFKFVEAAILVPQSLALALFPLISRLTVNDPQKLKNLYFRGLLILLFISLPFLLVFNRGAETVLQFAYQTKYLAAIPIMKILSLAVLLFFLNSLAGNIIQNSKLVKKFLLFFGLNFIIGIVLCFWFINKNSIEGAAWAVVASEFFGLFINNLFVWQVLKGNHV